MPSSPATPDPASPSFPQADPTPYGPQAPYPPVDPTSANLYTAAPVPTGPGQYAPTGMGFRPGRSASPATRIIFSVVGLIFIVIIGIAFSAAHVPTKGTSTATGTISTVQPSSSSCVAAATYQVNGNPYTTTLSASQSPCTYRVGQSVTVDYHAGYPGEGVIATSPSIGSMAFFFIPLVAILGLGVFQGLRRRRRTSAGY